MDAIAPNQAGRAEMSARRTVSACGLRNVRVADIPENRADPPCVKPAADTPIEPSRFDNVRRADISEQSVRGWAPMPGISARPSAW